MIVQYMMAEEKKVLLRPLNPGEEQLQLPENPTLQDFQSYVVKLKEMRDFKNEKKNAFILLTKELGDLAQAMRETWPDNESLSPDTQHVIGLKLADIFVYLLDLANQHSVSLEPAFREREEINKRREWDAAHRA
ncbi:hypothetical protein [Burkholderia contaminans]|uniref:hypothetical protein n=1 Tax=Burkholderia contaminans TaxID=488447 RepID=UPI001CF34F3C|nr:hypothetical protein [Burkholderia contaminans]MCA8096754.1 hypothetical protein [Burkholderia contaminans]